MTNKSRNFLIVSAFALALGLGGGLIAYLGYVGSGRIPPGVPAEARYIPADAALVAFANVRAIMQSDLRRQLMPTIEMRSRKGHQMMNDFAGIDLEKEVDHVVGFVAASPRDADPPSPNGQRAPNAMMLVQGNFQQGRIEQFIRDRGGVMQTHNGRSLAVHTEGGEEGAVGFVRPDLIAIGQAALVRRALDLSSKPTAAKVGPDLTANAEVMNLVRDASDSTAWVVGHFDAITRGMNLPEKFSGQVPPVRLVSATANINGGVKAIIRAETADTAAAEQLRDVVRTFVSLARLHGGAKPEFQNTLKSIELTSADKTVRLSFAVSSETVKALAPRPRQ